MKKNMKKIAIYLCLIFVISFVGCDTSKNATSNASLKEILTFDEDVVVEYTMNAVEELNANSFMGMELLYEYDEKNTNIYWNSYFNVYEMHCEGNKTQGWFSSYPTGVDIERVTSISVRDSCYNVYGISTDTFFSDVPKVFEKKGFVRVYKDGYPDDEYYKYVKGDLSVVVWKSNDNKVSEIFLKVEEQE